MHKTESTAPLVITGDVGCIRCFGVISHAAIREGNYIGSQSNGFICCECILRQLEAIQVYWQSVATFYGSDPTRDYPCARCDQPFLEGYLVSIDGKIGELCVPCMKWYSTRGGIPKGTEMEWILKLR